MAKWIMVVDDDTSNLQMAGHILSKNNMRVTALKSGRALLDYIDEKGVPDLILLDIKMPEMDGFETLSKLRELEKKKGINEVPVIFLTADENTGTETRGFEVGVSDFIRKPFNPDVLLKRIENVISMQHEMLSLKSEATLDKLTGFLNKGATTVKLSEKCNKETGCLMMIDLDSFKLVNDIYGHEMGDKVLISFAEIIKATVPQGSENGRIGGDEFVSFCIGMTEENQVAEITRELNEKLVASAKEMMGEDMNIPLGVSVGAIMVPKYGNDYTSLLKLADKSLYKVKKNGKHGFEVYSTDAQKEDDANTVVMDIKSLSEILGERNVPSVALQMDMDAFSYVYRYIIRYIARHNVNACKVLFTLEQPQFIEEQTYKDSCDEFGNHVRQSLRKSDILTRSRFNQYYVFLTDIREEFTGKVINQIVNSWYVEHGQNITITYDIEFVRSEDGATMGMDNKHIIVVDDDENNLQLISKILQTQNIRVTEMHSGLDLVDYVQNVEELPDMVLLDAKMPEMDGYEVLRKLREIGGDAARMSVILMTADDSEGAEAEALELGAMDFVKKPFVPEVLLLRVNHILELVTLRKRFHKIK